MAAPAASGELAGEKVLEGEILGLLLGSANRDDHRFSTPDRFALLVRCS